MFIENTKDCILKTFQIRNVKIKFEDIRPKFFIIKIFIIPIVNSLQWKFLEADFKLNYNWHKKVVNCISENILC